MVRYESEPGPAQNAPANWPADSALGGFSGRHTVLVFLHPFCTCSEATLSELDRFLTWNAAPAANGELDVTVVISLAGKLDPSDRESAIVKRVQSTKQAKVFFDHGGVETRRFGAETSGFVAAYGPDGRLQFAGGITGGRGVTGENSSLRALQSAIWNRQPASFARLVFGCSLLGRAE